MSNEIGTLAWAVEKARERPGMYVVRHGRSKARWSEHNDFEWENGVTVLVVRANLTGWSLVEEAPRIGSWWRTRAKDCDVYEVCVRKVSPVGVSFEFTQGAFETKENFLKAFEPCEPPPREQAIRALVDYVETKICVPVGDRYELNSILARLKETSGE